VTEPTLRLAVPADAPRLAQLHASRITEGFLAQLGPSFLTRLYRRMAGSQHAFVVVADDGGRVVAMCAAAQNVRRLYVEFIARDGVMAGITSFPRLVRGLPKVVETLRYPAATGELPDAEILSLVTDPGVVSRGLASAVLGEALRTLDVRGCDKAKVVIASWNDATLRLHRRHGFVDCTQISVHGSAPSEVLIWASS
jgi:ribosomal protein S18 acetylase RimI-like enzyme